MLKIRNDANLLSDLPNGPLLAEIPVITTPMTGFIHLIDAGDIALAVDDAGMELDRSESSTLVMTDTPESSPAATSQVSMFQRNYIAFRVIRSMSWLRCHTNSVVRMSVNY